MWNVRVEDTLGTEEKSDDDMQTRVKETIGCDASFVERTSDSEDTAGVPTEGAHSRVIVAIPPFAKGTTGRPDRIENQDPPWNDPT